MIGRWQSNCVGDYCGGALYVAARHEGVEGDYVLAMYMDADPAIVFGRDLFGEPKKRAEQRSSTAAAAASAPGSSAAACG